MVFNGGKGGGQASPGPSACGSRLCRCFGFVLLVVIGVLLYTCMTLVSRNDTLNDRVLMYARELTRSRTKEQALEKRTTEMRQQNFHCHSQLSERSREFATLKVDTDNFKKQANDFHQKLETMATELKTKEDACVQMNSLCKKQTLEHEDELKRMKESLGTANVECDKKVIIELARVVRVLRAKYGAEPVTELAKAGVDVTRLLPFMGGSQLPDSNQLQISSQEQSTPSQQQPNSDEEKLKSGQQQPNSDEEKLKSGQQQPNSDQEKLKSGQQQPNSDQEQLKSGQQQPNSDQENLKSGQQQPSSDQEKPKSFHEHPVQGQLQFKRPEDIKRDEGQNQRSEGEKLNEDEREKQKSTQEQPKADQTEKEKGKSETEDTKSLGQGSDHSNRDEQQKSRSSREKFREDEEGKPKQDDAKGRQENSTEDGKERAAPDQELLKQNQANEEEKDKSEKKDAKPGQEDVKTGQNSDRYKADEE